MADSWSGYSISISVSSIGETSAVATAYFHVAQYYSIASTLGYTLSCNGGSSSWTHYCEGGGGTYTLGSWTITGLTQNTSYSVSMSFDPRGTYITGAGSMPSMSTSTSFKTKVKTYTVSYNANGGSGAPGNQTKTHNVTLTLSSTKPTRTGYTFLRWNTAANGSGTNYNSGASYTANAGATLYAQWQINTYNVTINPNGGSFTSSKNSTAQTSAQTYTVNYGTSITSINGTRSGYLCNGWYTAASGGTRVVPNNGSLSNIGQAYTIYAQWTQETPPPDPIYDIRVNIEDSWIPGIVWINVGGTWYRSVENQVNVNGTWRKMKVN